MTVQSDIQSIITSRARTAGYESEFSVLLQRARNGNTHGHLPSKDGALEHDGQIVLDFMSQVDTALCNRIFRHAYFSTTRSERLGFGYSCIQAGDEIWLLKSCKTPVILRLIDVHAGTYEFVSLAYVDGIMNYELEKSRTTDLSQMKKILLQ